MAAEKNCRPGRKAAGRPESGPEPVAAEKVSRPGRSGEIPENRPELMELMPAALGGRGNYHVN